MLTIPASLAMSQSIKNARLENFVDYKGFLPYKEMLKELMSASYLLVCASEKRHVPGKLFEYLRTGKPIIAFGDDNEEVKQILEETNAGMMFRYNESAKEFFEEVHKFHTDLSKLKTFKREFIAKELAEILDKAIALSPKCNS